jgi:hypothetical protein
MHERVYPEFQIKRVLVAKSTKNELFGYLTNRDLLDSVTMPIAFDELVRIGTERQLGNGSYSGCVT